MSDHLLGTPARILATLVLVGVGFALGFTIYRGLLPVLGGPPSFVIGISIPVLAMTFALLRWEFGVSGPRLFYLLSSAAAGFAVVVLYQYFLAGSR